MLGLVSRYKVKSCLDIKLRLRSGGFILCDHYFNRCPGCEETTTESLVFISSDRKHDHHAVQHFTAMALTHLRESSVA